MIIRAAEPGHYAWIAERAHLCIGPSFRALEAVTEDGRILGMVGFDSWTPNSVSMHVALERPTAARHLIRPAFGIAFVEFDRKVVFGTVLGNNPRALELDLHLGFREVARLRDAWEPGVDTVILEMRREECRWINHGKIRKAA